MTYLHTMIRVQNLESALDFFINKLGMIEVRRREAPEGRFTLVFLATGPGESTIELTYNWDQEEPYTVGRNFGHLAYSVENIYQLCEELQNKGVTILRPPRDGKMAFIRSPDQIFWKASYLPGKTGKPRPHASLPNHHPGSCFFGYAVIDL